MATEVIQRSFEEKVRRMTPVAAPPDQREGVAAIFRLLDGAADVRRQRGACKLVGPSGEAIAIPESMFYVLERVAEVMARGDAITVVPVGQELTTQQAADMLNVSRQYLVRLLNDGRIPYMKTGKHRRVQIADVVAFKEQRRRKRKAGLDKLTQMSEQFGGYGEFK